MKTVVQYRPRLTAGVLLAALAFSLYLAASVPYSATDDWQWGMEEGVRWWLSGSLNGRYGGNFFAVVMCRSQLAKTLIMGLTIFALPLLMALLAARGDRTKLLPLFVGSWAGLLLMPAVMWQETYGWVAGFGNYVIPTALFFLWLLLVRRAAQRGSGKLALALFPLTFLMGLFVENLSALFLGCSLVLALYALWDKGVRWAYWACLAGAVLGAALMFLNGMFAQLADTGSALNGLRELTFSKEEGLLAAAWDIAAWYVGRLLPIAFLRGAHMAVPLAVITACAFWRSPLRPLSLLGLLPLACCAWFFSTDSYRAPLQVALSLLSWALPLLALLARRGSWPEKLRPILLYLCAPLALAPLAVTTTLGQRLYFFSTAVLVLSAVEAASFLLTRSRAVLGVTAVLALCLSGMWGYRHGVVWGCSHLRIELTQEAIDTGADTLVLPTDRYERVVWATRNPWNAEYAQYFRRFYHLSDDVTVIFLPAGSYERWPEIAPQDWESRMEFAPGGDITPTLP